MTIIGLALAIGPLTTMAHEVGGHAAACLALGQHLADISAYYVDCDAVSRRASRLVAMAGTGVDLILFAAAYALWRRAEGDLLRLALWYVFTVKGLVATGYWLFSGVIGIGDWAPGPEGGMGPMALEWAWRVALVLMGLAGYIGVVRLANASLRVMIGGGEGMLAVQKRIALGFYLTNGAVAFLVGLLNPQGFIITLISAVASSFGGTAGLFNVAYARGGTEVPVQPFVVPCRPAVLALGILIVGTFAALLGPTIRLG